MSGTGYIKSVFGMDTTPAVEGLKKLRGALGTTAGKLGVVGLVFAYFGQRYVNKAIKETIAFQAEIAELTKLLGEAESLPLAEAIADLSTKMPLAREELSDVAATAARLGIRGTANILKFTKTMAMMGVATNITASAAADALARIAKQTKLPITQIENLGSSINELSNTTATSSSEIVENMRRMAPEYARMGFSVDQIAALSATMNVVSESATRAGTRLRRLMQEMTDPKKINAFAEAIGKTPVEFAKLRQENPAEVLMLLVEAMEQGDTAAIQLATTLDARARLALIALSQASGDLRQNLETSATAFKENTSLITEYSRFLEIVPSQIQLYTNEARELRREIGEGWLPIAVKLLELKRDFVRGASMTFTRQSFFELLGEDAEKVEGHFDRLGEKFRVYLQQQENIKRANEETWFPFAQAEPDRQLSFFDSRLFEEQVQRNVDSLNFFQRQYARVIAIITDPDNKLSFFEDEGDLYNAANLIAQAFGQLEVMIGDDTQKLNDYRIMLGKYFEGLEEEGVSAQRVFQTLLALGTQLDASGDDLRTAIDKAVPTGYDEVAATMADMNQGLLNDITKLEYKLKDVPWDEMWFTDEQILAAREQLVALNNIIAAGQTLTAEQQEEHRWLTLNLGEIEKHINRRDELTRQLEEEERARRENARAREAEKRQYDDYIETLQGLISEYDQLVNGAEGVRRSQERMWRAMYPEAWVDVLMMWWDINQALKDAKEETEKVESEQEKLFKQWQKKMDDLDLSSLQSKFRLMERVLSGISDGILDFTEAIITGSDNAAEAVVKMIQEIAAELLRSQIFRLLGSLPGFQKLFGIVKPGGGFATAATGPGSAVGTYKGYSDPLSGINFAVGRAPQMSVQPQESVVVHNTFSIQALDSRSVQEMLVQERDMIASITVNSIDRSSALKRRLR